MADELITEKIKNGITRKLAAEFPDTKIFAEPVKQGFERPCFMVSCVSQTQQLHRGRQYVRDYTFTVLYDPQSDTAPEAECNAVLERLFWALEFIDVDGVPFPGRSLNSRFTDGLMSFVVDYQAVILKPAPDAVTMGGVERLVSVK